MQHQPALFDRAVEAGLVFRRRAPQFIQERAVDLLDQNAVVEVRLDRVGEIDDLRGGDFGIGERSSIKRISPGLGLRGIRDSVRPRL